MKAMTVEPHVVRRGGAFDLGSVEINAYAAPLADERERLGDDALRRMLRDMMLIRAFEEMLDGIKRERRWRGVSYEHGGPAHLSIGQEAAAVGQAFLLDADDHVYGSHRSHGEIIAKCLSAAAKLSPYGLDSRLRAWLDGETLDVVEQALGPTDRDTRAVQFVLYGLAAEIFGRRAGFNRGMGGSMHAFFPPLGSYPNNAIVGGSAPIAAGAALRRRVAAQPGLVMANVGDGSTGCGPVWEALNFASMGQLYDRWEPGHRGGLPVIFFFVNNFYAMGGQTIGETMGYEHLARIGAGVNRFNLHAEVIDGNNPLAVVDAVRRKRTVIEAGDGPVVLDVQCYRQSGHSPSDASTYRTREELEAWKAVDPIEEFGAALEAEGTLSAADRAALWDWACERVEEAAVLAADGERSPRLELDASMMSRVTFNGASSPPPERLADDLRMEPAESSRFRRLARVARSGLDEHGEVRSSARAITLRDALFEAVADHVLHDERLVIYGEENRDWDGAFGVYRGLTELLPYHRLFNSPISEAAIIASAVGLALEGGRALVELMYADFMGRAGDELFNQLAKWQAMSGGTLRLPVVVRASIGSKYGAQHSQDWSALAAHVPGLKVVYPATPYDAKGLLAAALAGDDPVIFFESQRAYDWVETMHPEGVPAERYELPIGLPDVKRAGKDLTILSVGPTLPRALAAAEQLSARYGVEAEVMDARSLVPFDYEPLLESVRRTNRLLLTSDACARGSFVQTVASTVTRAMFDDLDAPPVIATAPNWIVPAKEQEDSYFPQPAHLVDVVHRELIPLAGHEAASQRRDLVSLARAGV